MLSQNNIQVFHIDCSTAEDGGSEGHCSPVKGLYFLASECSLASLLPEHWNYFGLDEALGPVAVSIRREKLEEEKELTQQYNYRIIFRTSEVIRATPLTSVLLSAALPGHITSFPILIQGPPPLVSHQTQI